MTFDYDDYVADNNNNNNNDKSNTSSLYISLFVNFSFLLPLPLSLSSGSPLHIHTVTYTSGTETAAARICEEFLSFLLTPAGFSLWIFLSLKKIRRRVTFRVNGLRAALIVSIHAPTSRLAHAPIHVALCCLRNTLSKNRLHRR